MPDSDDTSRVKSPQYLAISIGLSMGCLLGLHEAIGTVHANAWIQPSQYFWIYFFVPILSWCVLGALLSLVFAWGASLIGRRRGWVSLPSICAAPLIALGLGSLLFPWIQETVDKLRAEGSDPTAVQQIALWLAGGAVWFASGLAATAAVEWYCSIARRPFRVLRATALSLCVFSAVPIARFLLTEWKWGSPGEARVARRTPEHVAQEACSVVLISVDTLRADALGAYGAGPSATPNLDRLAAEGLVFGNAVTSAPWTLPAVASLMTGLYPHSHGAGRLTNGRTPLGRSSLPAGTWTLASAFGSAGYRTHAIVTNPYLVSVSK